MDDKKKLAILGVLVLVVLAIGAYSFVPKGGDPAPAPVASDQKPEGDKAVAEEVPPMKNPMLADNRPTVDPFAIPVQPINPELRSTPSSMDPGKVRPTGIGGLKPPKGSLGGVLPGAEPGAGPAAEKVEPAIPPFTYTVSGVVIGRKPAAVFRDAEGKQKLISQGALLDGDTKVESVNLSFVAVSYHGKTLKLKVGGEQ
jgi:hypothetical protein